MTPKSRQKKSEKILKLILHFILVVVILSAFVIVVDALMGISYAEELDIGFILFITVVALFSYGAAIMDVVFKKH